MATARRASLDTGLSGPSRAVKRSDAVWSSFSASKLRPRPSRQVPSLQRKRHRVRSTYKDRITCASGDGELAGRVSSKGTASNGPE